jgi:hypothetical protein
MKAKDLTVGETYLVSNVNDWDLSPHRITRKVLLSAEPHRYESAGWGFSARTVDTVAVRTLATDAAVIERYGDVTTVDTGDVRPNGTKWTLTYSGGNDYVGALMVAVDENGNPDGPAHVVALRDIRDTYEHGTAVIQERQRARAKAKRERAQRENDRQARFYSARDSVRPSNTWDIRMYDERVSMSLEEFERIAALAARALAAES